MKQSEIYNRDFFIALAVFIPCFLVIVLVSPFVWLWNKITGKDS